MTEGHRRPRLLLRPLVLALALSIATSSGAAVGLRAASIGSTVDSLGVANRAFSPNADGALDQAALRFTLSRPATVTVRILDYRGGAVRTLVNARAMQPGDQVVSWDGRSASGSLYTNAGYRFRLTVTNSLGTFSSDLKIVKARVPVYPAKPGSITVAIDAGHGGPDPGAIRYGLKEATPNLDIALRLKAMLEGAGVRVVITRTSDSRVNRRNIDWTGDRIVTHRDELASRIEVANTAAADLMISVHNNAFRTKTGATEVWYTRDRSFAVENRLLASLAQANLMAQLRTLRTGTWRPSDRGIKRLQFYQIAPYRPGFLPRPSLMPGIVGESLSMSHPYENRLLKSATGRQRIAEGYYDAIARYLALRKYGARFALLDAPERQLDEGAAGLARVRVTNTSPRSWDGGAVALTLSAVRAVPYYDGSNAAGALLASVVLPDPLGPGESVDVEVPFTVPAFAPFAATQGRVFLKADLVEADQRYASHGVVPLQVPLTIGSLAPTPEPTPLATPEPTTDPGTNVPAQATPAPTVAPTSAPEPTPAPTVAPTTEPEPTPAPTVAPTTAPELTPAPTPDSGATPAP